MKRILCLALLAAMLVCTCLRVSADEAVPNFAFELTANGAAELEAKPGDILTVTLRLVRTDSTEPVSLQAMQDEITYDSAFFSLEDGGALAASGVVTQEISLRDGNRAYYMNYLALGGAERWEADTTVGVFRLKVIGESGASVIESRNFLVSGTGGEGSCTAEARNVTVRVSPASMADTAPRLASRHTASTMGRARLRNFMVLVSFPRAPWAAVLYRMRRYHCKLVPEKRMTIL